MQDAECWIEDRGNRKQDTGYKNSDRKQDTGYKNSDRIQDWIQ